MQARAGGPLFTGWLSETRGDPEDTIIDEDGVRTQGPQVKREYAPRTTKGSCYPLVSGQLHRVVLGGEAPALLGIYSVLSGSGPLRTEQCGAAARGGTA